MRIDNDHLIAKIKRDDAITYPVFFVECNDASRNFRPLLGSCRHLETRQHRIGGALSTVLPGKAVGWKNSGGSLKLAASILSRQSAWQIPRLLIVPAHVNSPLSLDVDRAATVASQNNLIYFQTQRCAQRI